MVVDAKPSLVRKLAAIMADPSVGKIEKKGVNAHFQYRFVQEEDVSDAVRPLLAKANVMVFPSVTSERREGTLSILNVALTFVDGDSGERETVNMTGYGADTQDKGANKAYTAAVKYGLIKTFLIASGEDADAGHGAARAETARPTPIRQPAAGQSAAPAAMVATPVADGDGEAIVAITSIVQKSGPLENGKPKWTKYVIKASDGQEYGTFSRTYATEAKRAQEGGLNVVIRYTNNQYGNDILRDAGLAVIESAA